MAMLDSTVANLAIGTISKQFAAPLGDVQWVATSYLITLALSLPLTGWLARRVGSNRLWRAAMFAFIASSTVCGLSGDLATLIVARCSQGLAAGLMVPAGQALLAEVADRRQLGRLMGTVGFAVALGPALGPGLAGALLESFSWRWLFWINIPIGMVAIIVAKFVLPPNDVVPAHRFDTTGLLLISLGLPLVLYGAATIGVADGAVSLFMLALGVGFIFVFVKHANRSIAPLIDIRLFCAPNFSAAVATAGLTGATMYGSLLLIPLYLQDTLHLSPTNTGFMLLAMGLGSAFALPVAGHIADRYGALKACVIGSFLLLLTVAPFWFSTALTFVNVAILLFVRGGGLALAQMPAMTAAYAAVSKEEMGDAATIINIAQRLGGALGAITIVIVVDQVSGTGAQGTYELGLALLGVFAIASIVTSMFLTKPPH